MNEHKTDTLALTLETVNFGAWVTKYDIIFEDSTIENGLIPNSFYHSPSATPYLTLTEAKNRRRSLSLPRRGVAPPPSSEAF